MDSRQHRRVRMRLPARLRWTTPFGQKIELANTIDVSRGGLLVSTKERHAPGVTVWVTFPHDASLSDGQRRFPGASCAVTKLLGVIRAANARERVPSATPRSRNAPRNWINLRVPAASRMPGDVRGCFSIRIAAELFLDGHAPRSESERPTDVRKALAIPIRVHPEQIPWLRKPLTLDISEKGMRFRSSANMRPEIA